MDVKMTKETIYKEMYSEKYIKIIHLLQKKETDNEFNR